MQPLAHGKLHLCGTTTANPNNPTPSPPSVRIANSVGTITLFKVGNHINVCNADYQHPHSSEPSSLFPLFRTDHHICDCELKV